MTLLVKIGSRKKVLQKWNIVCRLEGHTEMDLILIWRDWSS